MAFTATWWLIVDVPQCIGGHGFHVPFLGIVCVHCLLTQVLSRHHPSSCVSEHLIVVSFVQRAWFIQKEVSSPWLWAIPHCSLYEAEHGRRAAPPNSKAMYCIGRNGSNYASLANKFPSWHQKLHSLYESSSKSLNGTLSPGILWFISNTKQDA